MIPNTLGVSNDCTISPRLNVAGVPNLFIFSTAFGINLLVKKNLESDSFYPTVRHRRHHHSTYRIELPPPTLRGGGLLNTSPSERMAKFFSPYQFLHWK